MHPARGRLREPTGPRLAPVGCINSVLPANRMLRTTDTIFGTHRIEIEVLVLRHALSILRRQAGQPPDARRSEASVAAVTRSTSPVRMMPRASRPARQPR